MDLTSSDLDLGADGTTSQIVGLRFPNLDIPHGVYILSAYVEFEVDETGSSTISVLLQGQASDDAPAFTTSSGNISDRLRTSAQVAWNDIPPWTAVNAKWQTPDLAPIVQEIVDRSGWSAGNALVILISGTGRRTAESYDGEPAAAPKLVVTNTQAVKTPTPTRTLTLTPSPTRTPTAACSPTQTYTATSTLSSTWTQTPTATSAPTHTPTNSDEPEDPGFKYCLPVVLQD